MSFGSTRERTAHQSLENASTFLDFCDQLTTRDDLEFHGTEEDVEKLKKEIKATRSALATP